MRQTTILTRFRRCTAFTQKSQPRQSFEGICDNPSTFNLNRANFNKVKSKFDSKSENEQTINQILDQLAQKIFQNQNVIDYFKQLDQETANQNPKEQQVKHQINNTIQYWALKEKMRNNQNGSSSINSDMTDKKPAKPML